MRVKSSFPFRYVIVLFLLLFLSIALMTSTDSILNGFIFFVGLGSILVYLIGKKKKDYFEPMYLFSIYYIFVYIAAFFTASRGFQNNVYIKSTYFYNELGYIYTLTLFLCVVSYFSVHLGYGVFARHSGVLRIKAINGVKSPLFFLLALSLCIIGFINFFYNVYSMYGGNFIAYYRSISMRSYDFADGGSTLGYNFLYAGAYMLFVRWLQVNRNIVFTLSFVFFSILVFSSGGRITNTIFYLASFLMIFYYNKGYYSLNNSFFIIGVSIAALGVLFYSLRYASSLYYNNLYDFSDNGIFGYLGDFFALENLAFYLIDKGNIPNFALLMKVVDSWGKDLGYMFGATLLYPIYGFISTDLFGLVPMPAVIVKQEWYSHILGGNLPVTGMGEMIVNFSIIGLPLGMFLFGAMGAFFRNVFFKTNSNIYLIFYTKFCFFYLLYPKGEFNNFNLFWMSFPSIIFLLSVYFVRSFNSRVRVKNV